MRVSDVECSSESGISENRGETLRMRGRLVVRGHQEEIRIRSEKPHRCPNAPSGVRDSTRCAVGPRGNADVREGGPVEGARWVGSGAGAVVPGMGRGPGV